MMKGGKKLWTLSFSSLRNAWVHPGLDNSKLRCWVFPRSVCSTVSLFAMKIKPLNIHGILRLQKWEYQQLETLISFFPTGEGMLSVKCGKDCQDHGWEGV